MHENLYQHGFYASLSIPQIREQIVEEGFEPVRVSDPAGYIYPLHDHPETKLLAVLSGGMDVQVADQTYHCVAGDRLLIPGNVEHSARVMPDGCVYFWSEKLT
jgi:quercetin dioxygenase-like cupin family protein